jgi:hypothetical protein
MLKRTAMLFGLLAVSASIQAQEPSVPTGFLEILTDCLGSPQANVHECTARYVAVMHPGEIRDIGVGPDESNTHGTIKGKYNTCDLYPDTELSGDEMGYMCFDNITGKCVSGDCCSIVKTC